MNLRYFALLLLFFSAETLKIYSGIASLLTLSTLTVSPIGNINEAFKSVFSNSESITCTIATQEADEFHDSCQLMPRLVRFRAGKFLTINQDWGGSESTGAAVWNGANMAAWFMEHSLGSVKLQGTNVISLGAGVGFDSLVANTLGAKFVMITDGNEDVLKLADKNIEINVNNNNDMFVGTGRLRWNTEDENNFVKTKWDYIFASDVTYLKKNRNDLLLTISHLANPKTIAYISMEPRNVDEVEDVLRTAEANGFTWKEERLPLDPIKDRCNIECPRMFSLRKNS